jgi:uncharacterized membrane protein
VPAAGDPELEARAADRMTLFSDAVVAIAITLLAIDLPVPEGRTTAEFLSDVSKHLGSYSAFLISFVSIAGSWANHHDLFHNTRRVDAKLRHLNMLWLLTIVLLPFATKLLTNQGNDVLAVHALRYGFYALVQAVESLLVLAMLRYMTANDMAEGLPADKVTSVTEQSSVLILGFALSIPVFFATTYGWVLWIAIPLVSHSWLRNRRRNDRNLEPR